MNGRTELISAEEEPVIAFAVGHLEPSLINALKEWRLKMQKDSFEKGVLHGLRLADEAYKRGRRSSLIKAEDAILLLHNKIAKEGLPK